MQRPKDNVTRLGSTPISHFNLHDRWLVYHVLPNAIKMKVDLIKSFENSN